METQVEEIKNNIIYTHGSKSGWNAELHGEWLTPDIAKGTVIFTKEGEDLRYEAVEDTIEVIDAMVIEIIKDLENG